MSKPNYRTETDSMGEVKVEADKYWGAQTQRSLLHFKIGREHFPRELIRALGIVKKACAQTNIELDLLDSKIGKAIISACDEVIDGTLDEHFPLYVWQTGSGTQTNMNANEVIANRACELLGGERGDKNLVHPNDHVNMSQSSNDVFPTVMHLASLEQIHNRLFCEIDETLSTLEKKIVEFEDIIKIGRTHLMDATPLTLAQEFSGYHNQVSAGKASIMNALNFVKNLAIGASAVGTGLNTPIKFSELTVKNISQISQQEFRSAPNKFEALASHDSLVGLSGALKRLACSLLKIANDIRWLGSGPRTGLGELILPANEPGSSIMPGKVNPTQCEALTMVCAQVIGNDTTISIAGSQGNFELNVYKPVIIHNILQSINLLSDSLSAFNHFCLKDLKANKEVLAHNVERSLMLVTALSPHVGYDKAAKVAKKAFEENLSLAQSAAALGIMSEEEFYKLVRPENMIAPHPS